MISLRNLIIAATTALACAMPARAADLVYVDAAELRIINKAFDNTANPYSRLPTKYKTLLGDLWWATFYTPGVAVRFATNSRNIAVDYMLHTNCHVNAQAATGTKGVDLYILEGDSAWRHMNCLRPLDQKKQSGILLENLNGAWHEFMLYLPTYDGVTQLSIGIDATAQITKGNPECINMDKVIVAYGSSILQGGCASRPGMIGTSIISRELNCQVVNFGFSGNARFDNGFDQVMSEIEHVDCFIIDPVPNCDDEMCRTGTYDFVNKIRQAHPGVPIVMVEGPMYPYARHNLWMNSYLPKKNEYYRAAFDRLVADNPDGMYYVTCENLDGVEDDGTIDGIHLSDLGFRHYADKLVPLLSQIVKGERLHLTAPADGSTDMTLTPTFTWNDASRSGNLEISTSASFTEKDIVLSAPAQGGSYTVPACVLGNTMQYYARISYTIDGVRCTTPIISFSTKTITPQQVQMAWPLNGGVIHANEHFAITPVEGINSMRLEVSTSTSFPARTSYINGSITTTEWQDRTAAMDVRLGTSALMEGRTYYARVRSTYNTPNGVVNSDYSDIVEFTYSAQESAVTEVVAPGDPDMTIVGNGTTQPAVRLTGAGQVSLRIYSVDGILLSVPFAGVLSDGCPMTLELSSLAPGQYIATIIGENVRRSNKVIVTAK